MRKPVTLIWFNYGAGLRRAYTEEPAVADILKAARGVALLAATVGNHKSEYRSYDGWDFLVPNEQEPDIRRRVEQLGKQSEGGT